MTFDYSNLKATADRLILRFGKAATLHQPTPETGPAYDPTPGATLETPITAVDFDQSVMKRPETLVEGVSRTLLVSTSAGVTPETDDQITVDGTRHHVVGVRPLNPGGTVLLFEVDLGE